MSEPFIGQITLFAGNFAPRGWALCDGQTLAISQNQALFAILGTTYGGNGVSTFMLPDLRGRGPVHPGQGAGTANIVLGEVAGNPTTTLTIQNMVPQSVNIPAKTVSVAVPAFEGDGNLQAPSTTGVLAKPKDTSVGAEVSIYYAPPAGTTPTLTTLQPFNLSIPGNTAATAGGNLPFSNQSPYLGINFIIALEGLYPTRN